MAEQGWAKIWIYNVSSSDLRVARGTRVGNLEMCKLNELVPWDINEELLVNNVSETTPTTLSHPVPEPQKLSRQRKILWLNIIL